ncbi:MAG: HEPN domain-containing protein [Gluconobacter potus]|uniref:HEPN domain-containing protein n=1 Tax=Gluconobacter potus TaxID=2724927 RepID=UPI0039E7663A
MSTAEFSALESAIDYLKQGLMNFSSRDDGNYTVEELLKCQAFVVFSHAEIEVYLEKVSRKIMTSAQDAWRSNSIYGRVISALVAFRSQGHSSVPNDPKICNRHNDIEKIIEQTFIAQEEIISKNNGIKRSNLAQMIFPLGVLSRDIDETLLILLDNTGAKRGEIVHKASRVSLGKVRDPFTDELSDIYDLISEISVFDNKIVDLFGIA